MSTIIVAGGTSVPGPALVARLRADGHDGRILSRKPGNFRVVGALDKGVGLNAGGETNE